MLRVLLFYLFHTPIDHEREFNNVGLEKEIYESL